MSLLPTMLMMIFHRFYSLKAHAWAQLKLQRWYFGFMAVYILLITAVGSSLLAGLQRIYDHPPVVFGILASALPTATNFFLEFMLVQWVSHGVNLTRFMQAAKFLGLRPLLGTRRAAELAEPEDQDYYGIGGRSARSALDLVIALVFCGLNPLITAVTLVNFVISRLTYGYLTVFAETRKPDLGGPFFVQQMWHVQFGLLLYAVLMSSIFYRRAGSWGPFLLSLSAVACLVLCIARFSRAFSWERLPFCDVCSDEAVAKAEERMQSYRAQGPERPSYHQPELYGKPWVVSGLVDAEGEGHGTA